MEAVAMFRRKIVRPLIFWSYYIVILSCLAALGFAQYSHLPLN